MAEDLFGGSPVCWREFKLLEGVWLLPLVFNPCGWVGEASFGDEGLAHGSKPTAIICCNGFVLQRLLSGNGYFLATATFGGGVLAVL